MNLQELLIYIMKHYNTNDVFKNNDVANKIRKEIKSTFPLNSKRLEFKGSPGQGSWAEIPWIGLFDKKYYKVSAQRGIYIVYLLSADHKSMYLSLMQGWTHFDRTYGFDAGKRIAQNLNQKIREFISRNNLNHDEYYKTNMDLQSHKPNAVGYEIVNILCKKYQLTSMPSNYEIENDLHNMIFMLESINDSDEIKSLIKEYYDDNNEPVNKDFKTFQKKKSVKIDPPRQIKKPRRQYTGKAVKKNYDQIYKSSKSIGNKGEEWIFNHEKQYLIERNLPELSKQVDWVSKTLGDGLGYDILSFDEDGNERYIEVKTTTGNENVRFPISINEVLASEKYSDKYYLYRVFNYDEDHPEKIQYYSLHGNMYDILNLESTQFDAFPK